MAIKDGIAVMNLTTTSSLVCTLAFVEKGPTPHIFNIVQVEFGKNPMKRCFMLLHEDMYN